MALTGLLGGDLTELGSDALLKGILEQLLSGGTGSLGSTTPE